MSFQQRMPREIGMTAWPIGRCGGNIAKKGAKYLVILAEGGVPSVEQRMPQIRVTGSTTPR
jgi:hypothetical protein